MSERSRSEKKVIPLLANANIQVNGSNPWDIQVHEPAFYSKFITQGSVGLGESYTKKWWDCEQLDGFILRLINDGLRNSTLTLKDRFLFLSMSIMNGQCEKKSLKFAQKHYDIGNELYQKMLGKSMQYSCGYWQDANNLQQAQGHKLELICRKLQLKPGMRVLDIGCGWGGAAKYMSEKYKVTVVGITNSKAQRHFALQQVKGLPVQIRLQDYRHVNESFDRIVSIGMFEHVGFKNYADYFEVVDRCLRFQGLFLLQTVGHYKTSPKVDPWIAKHIFVNTMLPSAELITQHTQEKLTIEDWHNFGLDYVKTLHAWQENCDEAWPNLTNYDHDFQRKWRYYLMYCSAAFQSYRNNVWQIVFSKGAQTRNYRTARSGA